MTSELHCEARPITKLLGKSFREVLGSSLERDPTRFADAQVMTESTVYLIPKGLFTSFCDGHPAMWRLLAQPLLERSRTLQKKSELLCTRDVEYRILHCLAESARSFGTRSESG